MTQEEFVVDLANEAYAMGLDENHPDWPILYSYSWSGVQEADTLSNAPSVPFVRIIGLRLQLTGIDGSPTHQFVHREIEPDDRAPPEWGRYARSIAKKCGPRRRGGAQRLHERCEQRMRVGLAAVPAVQRAEEVEELAHHRAAAAAAAAARREQLSSPPPLRPRLALLLALLIGHRRPSHLRSVPLRRALLLRRPRRVLRPPLLHRKLRRQMLSRSRPRDPHCPWRRAARWARSAPRL